MTPLSNCKWTNTYYIERQQFIINEVVYFHGKKKCLCRSAANNRWTLRNNSSSLITQQTLLWSFFLFCSCDAYTVTFVLGHFTVRCEYIPSLLDPYFVTREKKEKPKQEFETSNDHQCDARGNAIYLYIRFRATEYENIRETRKNETSTTYSRA